MTTYRSRKVQHGASTLGILFILISLATFMMVGVKVVPMYMDNATINSVVTGLENEPGIVKLNHDQLHYKIMKLLTINNIRSITNEQVVIKRENGKLTVDVDYEVRENIYRNLDAVASFKNHFETKIPEGQ